MAIFLTAFWVLGCCSSPPQTDCSTVMLSSATSCIRNPASSPADAGLSQKPVKASLLSLHRCDDGLTVSETTYLRKYREPRSQISLPLAVSG